MQTFISESQALDGYYRTTACYLENRRNKQKPIKKCGNGCGQGPVMQCDVCTRALCDDCWHISNRGRVCGLCKDEMEGR